MEDIITAIFTIIGVALGIILIGLGVLAWAGVVLGAGNAWILEGTFGDGWGAIWDRPLPALGWATLFIGLPVAFGSGD